MSKKTGMKLILRDQQSSYNLNPTNIKIRRQVNLTKYTENND